VAVIGEDAVEGLGSVALPLVREGLVAENFQFTDEQGIAQVRPTGVGAELFLWGHGVQRSAGRHSTTFARRCPSGSATGSLCMRPATRAGDPRPGDPAVAPARSARRPGGPAVMVAGRGLRCRAGPAHLTTIQAYRARRHDLGLAARPRPNPSARSRIKKEPGVWWRTKRAAKRSAEATTIDDSGRFNCAQPIGYAAPRPCR
jgi:hypothetical protein